MKETVIAFVKGYGAVAAGGVGGLLSWLMGGFDTPVLALVIIMGIDYVMGLMVAGIFHTSPKTPGGGLDSRVGWKGLFRKFATLMIVVVANLADMLLGSDCIRDGVIIGFFANEGISILENAGCMGISIPEMMAQAFEVLHKKGEGGGEDE